jgi:Fic-DOC domain mobile mystery protein B
VGLDLGYIQGQTPLDEDEKEGLLIPTIATREELDEFEQQNIEDALQWLLSLSLKPARLFNEKFVKDLHEQMFGNVWAWAGTFRISNKNLGVDKHEITAALAVLLGEANYWLEHKSYCPDELAVRFKHRLVSIHCFPNGNGRHSRLMADALISKIFNQPMFSWGALNLAAKGEARAAYLAALKQADNCNYTDLIAFSRS